MTDQPAISLTGVGRSFGAIDALDDVDLEVERGVIFGLVGPSGSGKTTLVRVVAGLLRARGQVRMLGHVVPDVDVLARVGYMPQQPALYDDLTVHENLTFFAEIQGVRARERVTESLELVGLAERAGDPVRTLSGGMVRRLSLAAALVHRPDVLLLDEPTVGLDPVLRQTFWAHFRELATGGVTIVVTTHVMDEADRVDRLGMLRAGRLLVSGTPDEIRGDHPDLESAFLELAEGEA